MPKSKKDKSKDGISKLQTILKHCMQLVTVHGRPLDLIEDEAFQQIINLADSDTPNQVNIRAVLDMVHEQASIIRHKISSEIKNILVCLKLDFVSCIQRKFIGINIQYIKDGEIIARNLAVMEVNQDNIETFSKVHFETVLTDFNITADKIYCICTDSETNINKIDLIIYSTYAPDNEDSSSIKQDVESNLTDEECNESNIKIKTEVNDPLAINFDEINIEKPNELPQTQNSMEITTRKKSSQNELFDELAVNIFLPHNGFEIRSMLCPTHMFQLAIKNALMKDLNARSAIIMSRKIVDTIREPIYMNKLKAAKLKNPLTDCPTEWTSMYNMLKRLITLKDFCDAIIDLSPYFWKEVSAIVECLNPANAAFTDLQRQNLTIGDFYIIWLNCKSQIATIDHRFAETLHNAMQVQETIFLKNDAVLEVLYLDRRLNVMLNDEQRNLVKMSLKNTYERLMRVKDFTNDIEANKKDKILPMPSTNGCLPALEEMLVNAERSRGLYKTRIDFDACMIELENNPRISINENIITYWNNTTRNTEMAMVANTVLAVPVTRIFVEKLHSSLNFILDPNRRNLKQKLLRDMLLVKENCDLID